jgi:hypothetical protein
MTGQNDAVLTTRPKLHTSCAKKALQKGRHHSRKVER